MIEGDPLGDRLESIAYDVKFEATNDGGCLCKMASSYKTIGDFDVKEEDVKEGRESTIGIYKVVESYLLENPQVYAWFFIYLLYVMYHRSYTNYKSIQICNIFYAIVYSNL